MNPDPKQAKTFNFWGWGWEEDAVGPGEQEQLDKMIEARTGRNGTKAVAAPKVSDFEIPKPRFSPPQPFAKAFSSDARDRLRHTYGQSFEACVRMLMRDASDPPDYVVYPESESEISSLFDWAADAHVAIVPFGGGSSVCGGVDTQFSGEHEGVVSLDMARFDQVLEIDKTSRAGRFQAGMFGPALEDALRPHDLTLRHFPQSFEFSTLGGWIATRGGGHYASLYTHIDDFVESARMITPQGAWESRRLPGSGAGPSPDRMVLGSEGIFGVITEAWMRLQDRPTHRGSASVFFDSTKEAAECGRAIAQSGLFPTNCRLLDPLEARNTLSGDGSKAIMVLGFESADHPVDAWMHRALELVTDHAGSFDKSAALRSLSGKSAEHRTGAAGQWRNAFIRMPYLRDYWIRHGMIVDTFETSITWDRFHEFYADVLAQTRSAIRRVSGREVDVSCRLTHVYPDGAAPYFTYMFLGSNDGDLASCLSQWREIKAATNDIVVSNGGTVTHHHAVGRDHRSGYEAQTPALYRKAIAAIKRQVDPANLLNPGVLVDL